MTIPTFTTTGNHEDREYLPVARCRGKLLVVHPLEYQREGFRTEHHPDGTDVVFADVAVLDAIPEAENEIGDKLPGFPAGTIFRNQAILQGYLKGAWKRHIDQFLIGTVYFGPKTKGKPPIMWQDLSQDPEAVQRGQNFFVRVPEFLTPQRVAFAGDGGTVSSNGASANGNSGATTLDQLRAMGQANHHGQPQPVDAPF